MDRNSYRHSARRRNRSGNQNSSTRAKKYTIIFRKAPSGNRTPNNSSRSRGETLRRSRHSATPVSRNSFIGRFPGHRPTGQRYLGRIHPHDEAIAFAHHPLYGHGWQGNLFGNVQQTLPWKLRLSFYGGGSTPYISLQGEGSSYYFYGIGLSRSFLKEDRLNISISTSNIFQKYQTYNNETLTDTFRSWSESKSPNRYVNLSISWRFGELKTQVKKTARSIQNDDVKSGGNSGSQGGGQGGGM